MVEISSRLDHRQKVAALAQQEPHVLPWNKSFLEYRLAPIPWLKKQLPTYSFSTDMPTVSI